MLFALVELYFPPVQHGGNSVYLAALLGELPEKVYLQGVAHKDKLVHFLFFFPPSSVSPNTYTDLHDLIVQCKSSEK